MVDIPREILLAEIEKYQAVAYRNDGKTMPELGGILKIGKCAIAEFLKKPDAHRDRKKVRDPKK